MEYNTARYYFQKNIQGDVIRIFDSNANLVASYVYDAWGNHKVLNPNGYENTSSAFIGNINPFRYRGYYYDSETKLYYLNSRYYAPQVGRFINADDVNYIAPDMLGGMNLYAYCGDNPVMRVDPSGTSWWDDLWGGVRAAGQWVHNNILKPAGRWVHNNVLKPIGSFFSRPDVQKGLMIIGSSILIAGGIASMFIPGAQFLTQGLLGAGVSSLVGGFTNEAMGGSFLGGWFGGLVTGGVSGILPNAGLPVALGFGFVGGFVGNMATGWIDGKSFSDASLWGASLLAGFSNGIFNMALSAFKPAFGLTNVSDWFNAAVSGYALYFGGITAFRSWLIGLVAGAIMG